MFSTVKKLACICIFACVLNVIGGIGVISFMYTYLPTNHLFAHAFCALAYLATTSGILLAISCALFSACSDVNVNNDYHYEQFAKISKRLDDLEKK